MKDGKGNHVYQALKNENIKRSQTIVKPLIEPRETNSGTGTLAAFQHALLAPANKRNQLLNVLPLSHNETD